MILEQPKTWGDIFFWGTYCLEGLAVREELAEVSSDSGGGVRALSVPFLCSSGDEGGVPVYKGLSVWGVSLLALEEGGGGARLFLTGRVLLFLWESTESVSKGLQDWLTLREAEESLEAEFSKKGLVPLSSSSSLSSNGLREAGFCSITGSEKHRR